MAGSEKQMFGGPDLDPTDWEALRRQGHRMLDDMVDHLASLREQPVWREPPAEIRALWRQPPPAEGSALADVYDRFTREILPYGSGNIHPGFMGWAQGGGTAVGMLAELLSGTMNANLGGRDHMPIEVERQMIEWTRVLFGFPDTASGLFLTGTSQANFVGLLIARTRALGDAVRAGGLREAGAKLAAYASSDVHGCVDLAMEMAGIGSDNLRHIAVDADRRMRPDALAAAIAADRAAGLHPFLLVGTAGSVDVGAIDDLNALADIAAAENLHFHVDGAIGALAIMAPSIAPRLAGIERADSIGFDWHKWGHVPYDAGFILVRDGPLQKRTFASDAAYLRHEPRGLAGGDWWPSDYGPDLSRGFRALKTWFTVQTYGTRAMGAAIAHSCALAQALAERVAAEPELELLVPRQLNIVCFRFRAPGDEAEADPVNEAIVERLHEGGYPSPSVTTIDGRLAIRAALFNHRTREADVQELVDRVLEIGRAVVDERNR